MGEARRRRPEHAWPVGAQFGFSTERPLAPAGIPKFYRWLSERYPLINQPGGATVVPIIGQPPFAAAALLPPRRRCSSTAAASSTPTQFVFLTFLLHTSSRHASSPPFSLPARPPPACHICAAADNLYLDMNGIIHNCTHANNAEVKETEDQMIVKIFTYLDKLFHIVKPQARRAGWAALGWVGLGWARTPTARQRAASQSAAAAALGAMRMLLQAYSCCFPACLPACHSPPCRSCCSWPLMAARPAPR